MPVTASSQALSPFGPLVGAIETNGDASMRVVARDPEKLSLPDGVAVDGCRLFAMTIEARSRVTVAPSLRLRDRAAKLRFAPSSGQHLMAVELADQRGVLVLATHDGPWLATQGVRHGLVPKRFASLKPSDIEALVRCRDDGLEVALSHLERNESVRLFFSAAWAMTGRAGEPSTSAWLAAEAALPWKFSEHVT